MNNKGFLFTVLTVLISLSLIALASFFALEDVDRDFSAEKACNVFDDVKSDVEVILGLSASIKRSGGHVTVSFVDRFPLAGAAETLGEYEDFVEGVYAEEVGADLMISGLSKSEFEVVPYGLIYAYPSFDKEEIRLFDGSGDGDFVEEYVLEFEADKNLVEVVNQSTPGDLLVVLNGRFANTGYSKSFSVARDASSRFSFDFGDNSSLSLYFGRNMIEGARDSSFVANFTGDFTGKMRTDVVLEGAGGEVGVVSSIYLWFKNKVTREDYIWLAGLR